MRAKIAALDAEVAKWKADAEEQREYAAWLTEQVEAHAFDEDQLYGKDKVGENEYLVGVHAARAGVGPDVYAYDSMRRRLVSEKGTPLNGLPKRTPLYVIQDVAELAVRIARAGLSHMDLHAGNMVYLQGSSGDNKLVAIDWHNCEFGLPAATMDDWFGRACFMCQTFAGTRFFEDGSDACELGRNKVLAELGRITGRECKSKVRMAMELQKRLRPIKTKYLGAKRKSVMYAKKAQRAALNTRRRLAAARGVEARMRYMAEKAAKRTQEAMSAFHPQVRDARTGRFVKQQPYRNTTDTDL